jgi:hypothetical protein
MIARNIETRIVKLEARRRRPDELLLVWRRPGAAISAAVADANFAAGDRVICVEWFGDSPPPAPRWYRKRLSSELGAIENEYLTRSLNRVVEGGRPRDPGFVDLPPISEQRARELADNDLLHRVFGVAT